MTTSLKKAVLISFLFGMAIPCGIEVVGSRIDLAARLGMWWSGVVICLWPTSITLIETSRNWTGYLAFAIAAVVNGMIYALVALVIGRCFQLLKSHLRT